MPVLVFWAVCTKNGQKKAVCRFKWGKQAQNAGHMATDRQPRGPSRIRLPIWAVGLLALAFFILLAGSGVWVFRTIWRVAAEAPLVDQPNFDATVTDVPAGDSGADIPQPEITTAGEPEALLDVGQITPWEGTDRITILMLGIDRRCDEEGPVRTDSMMVATLDPVGRTIGLLSLPRDLWVEIPGFGVERINQAHYLGQGFEYPGGGPALAVDTVEATLGIDVDHFVTINFEAFVEFVDLIDGITISVPEAIDDKNYPDECYGYDPFKIDTGSQNLDGTAALKYARTRATEGGDVDRAGRQQAVILAAREKAISRIPDLLLQAPLLWQTFQKNVNTTLTLDETLQLALLVGDIPRENIRQAVIGYNDVFIEQTPDGQDVLVPRRDNLRAIRDELFATKNVPLLPLETLAEKMRDEQARVAIYNGTPTFGLASATETYLVKRSVNVVEIGNADSAEYASSQLIDFGDYPFTDQYLVELLGIPPLNVSQGQRPDGDYDVLVIIGSDWKLPEE